MSRKETSNFSFLQTEWPQLFAEGQKAEALVVPDPRTACFYARRTLELAVTWLYKSDSALKLPYQDNLSALIHEPTFQSRSRAENLHQGQADQRPWQSGRAQPQALAATGLDDRSARAVSYLLLAGAHLWQGRQSQRMA